MSETDLGVKVRLIPELNTAEFVSRVNGMNLTAKVKLQIDDASLKSLQQRLGRQFSLNISSAMKNAARSATTSSSKKAMSNITAAMPTSRELRNMQTRMQKMYANVQGASKGKSFSQNAKSAFEAQYAEVQKLAAGTREQAQAFSELQKRYQSFIASTRGGATKAATGKQITSLTQQMERWSTSVHSLFGSGTAKTSSILQFDTLYRQTQQMTAGTKEWLNSVEQLRGAYNQIQNQARSASSRMRVEQRAAREQAARVRETETANARAIAESTHLSNLQTQINNLMRNSPRLRGNQTIYQQLVGLQNRAQQPGADFSILQRRFSDLRSQITTLGLDTESLGQRISRLFQDHMNTAIAMAGLHLLQNSFREIYQSVVDIDTAMTDLKKVSSGTTQDYTNFLDAASDRAYDLGTTVSDVINATAEFSRLGYNLEESTDLADAALMYKNVSEYTNVSDAAQSIVSTMKAFDIEADDVVSIVDKFNEIGNSYAISSEGLGEAMQRSAASLALAGNSLDESLALVTGANEIVQDPDVVGMKCA